METDHPHGALLSIAEEVKLDLASIEFASELDRRDELASFKDQFLHPRVNPEEPSSSSCIYLCGNSLGLQPKRTKKYVMYELEEWEKRGVEGHFIHTESIEGRTATDKIHPWLTTDENVHARSAKLVGGKPLEVAVMNGLTVNLHLMMIPFYRPTSQRHKILIEGKSFPSDWVRWPPLPQQIIMTTLTF